MDLLGIWPPQVRPSLSTIGTSAKNQGSARRWDHGPPDPANLLFSSTHDDMDSLLLGASWGLKIT